MSVRLFPFTSDADARAILICGFTDATCWLSPSVETVCDGSGRSVLLEVRQDLTESDLQAFKQMVAEEVWDDVTGDFVPSKDLPAYHWYEIPAALVNARGEVRLVSAEERARLLQGEV